MTHVNLNLKLDNMKEYYFAGIRFVPGYNDFDFDDITIEATNEKEAWELLDKYTKRFTWKSVGLVSIDGVKVETVA
jgi:hypothetical protein